MALFKKISMFFVNTFLIHFFTSHLSNRYDTFSTKTPENCNQSAQNQKLCEHLLSSKYKGTNLAHALNINDLFRTLEGPICEPREHISQLFFYLIYIKSPRYIFYKNSRKLQSKSAQNQKLCEHLFSSKYRGANLAYTVNIKDLFRTLEVKYPNFELGTRYFKEFASLTQPSRFHLNFRVSQLKLEERICLNYI